MMTLLSSALTTLNGPSATVLGLWSCSLSALRLTQRNKSSSMDKTSCLVRNHFSLFHLYRACAVETLFGLQNSFVDLVLPYAFEITLRFFRSLHGFYVKRSRWLG